ncbi:DUF2470 domain-containing protein [Actinomadura parmotrematis]|uniref:DUF2470 domain-containing protein n=1 Tax=Actinomadura parmotrematis TaxID=2864039 RepID=A0ABS7G1T4_9ACTN|nr:DUF2470 domain-containing protein [Actinomadura parmotrematis]MBW8486663.1 DUF2470 domain-containing protein [Actinomadura parmotrematis]
MDDQTRRPTAAERARTLAYGVADGVLAAPGVPYAPVTAHITDEHGVPLLLMPAASPIAAALAGAGDDLTATLRLSDVAPVALPDRVRGRAWLHGWVSRLPEDEIRGAALTLSRLHPRPELLDLAAGDGDWTILAMDVAQIEVEDAWGSATLEPEEYALALPDPFVAIEAGILSHLDSAHRGELRGLLAGLPCAARATSVRPLGLDRHGLWLRCELPDGEAGAAAGEPLDLRVAFAEPVRDLAGLRCVYRRLFGAAVPRP